MQREDTWQDPQTKTTWNDDEPDKDEEGGRYIYKNPNEEFKISEVIKVQQQKRHATLH